MQNTAQKIKENDFNSMLFENVLKKLHIQLVLIQKYTNLDY